MREQVLWHGLPCQTELTPFATGEVPLAIELHENVPGLHPEILVDRTSLDELT